MPYAIHRNAPLSAKSFYGFLCPFEQPRSYWDRFNLSNHTVPGTISSTQWGIHCTKLIKVMFKGVVKGQYRSVISVCGICEGRVLNREA